MPQQAIYVGRPGKWGNPYSSAWFLRHHFDVERALKLYWDTAQGFWTPSLVKDLPRFVQEMVYGYHVAWLQRFPALGCAHPMEQMRVELRGRHLACWCRPDAKCHADILLELANR